MNGLYLGTVLSTRRIIADAIPTWPVDPLFVIDPSLGDGRGVPNALSSETFSKNIFLWSKAHIVNNGSTTVPQVTRFFANGPGGTNTAARVVWTLVASVFSVWSSTVGPTPPAGTYTLRFKAISNTGSSQDIRLGSASSPVDVTTETVTTSWQTFTKQITTSGSNYATFGILNDGAGNLPDILIDEIECYLTSELPASYEDVRDWGHRRRVNHTTTTLFDADGAMDANNGFGTVNSGIYGYIQAPQALTATADTVGHDLSAWTYLVIFKTASASLANNILVSTEANTNLGSTTNSLQFGVETTTGRPKLQPQNFGVSEFSSVGQGWQMLGARTTAGERSVNLGRWLMSWGNTASYTGFKVRNFLHGGSAVATQFNGQEALLVMWDTFLTDAQWEQAVTMAEYVAETNLGITLDKGAYAYSSLGDSITAGPSTSAAYGSLMGVGAIFDSNTYALPVRNHGVSGYGLTDIETLLTTNNTVAGTGLPAGPGGVLARIAEQIADGYTPIVSLMIGVNDAATIDADLTAWYTRLKAVWATLRAAGAKVIAITNLPASVGNNWETNRLTLRTNILADAATLLDGVVDFGDPSSFMGNSANLTNTTYWNVDQLHPLALGHSTYLAPLMKAGLIAQGVPA